jgi:F0F1-type ATP synthase assembly protein I
MWDAIGVANNKSPSYPPVKEQRDSRSPLALGMEWSSRITGVSLEMVVPALLGYWADQKLGTRGLFLIVGTLLGFIMGMMSLLRFVRPNKPDGTKDD